MPLTLPIKDPLIPPGSLFVVSTPIGNMEDITFRAVRILEQADWVAAEDTRHSRKLFSHYGISTPLISFHDHNKERRTPELLARIKSGDSVALITDAGTPSISDPGYYLVKSAIDASVPVVPIPGPSAFVAALSVSGLPTDSFLFVGFIPRKANQRNRLLQGLKYQDVTLIFYESPRRIPTLITSLVDILGDREAVMARELTKVYEEVSRGRLTMLMQEIAGREPLRGECTLLVAGYEASPVVDGKTIRKYLIDIRNKETGMSASDLVKTVARRYQIPRKRVYDEALKLEREGKI